MTIDDCAVDVPEGFIEISLPGHTPRLIQFSDIPGLPELLDQSDQFMEVLFSNETFMSRVNAKMGN